MRDGCRATAWAVGIALLSAAGRAEAATYFVSNSTGNDSNTGLSEAVPFATVGRVNVLALAPGDQVLFRCGDTWKAQQLVISRSGTEPSPIVFGSYPAGCADRPVLSGSRAVTAWAAHSGSVYRADLPVADFPMGMNQLFRGGVRLPLGRWPNVDAPNGGYSSVDAHLAGGAALTDNELPAVNWTGARIHIKNIRWSMLDRDVVSSNGTTLGLNQGLSCLVSGWADCVGWGYFMHSHLATLDRDGEWYYDEATRRVYLYSSRGVPADMEASVVQEQATTLRHGGLMLSDGSATAYVVVENLELRNWFNFGIGTPGGMNGDIYHHITVRDVIIRDVDAAGVVLSSWLERPSDGRKGLRGGHHMTFLRNTVDGANHFGITGYFAQSTFEDNELRNIALIRNLGRSGMGCGTTSSECTENGDGLRIRLYDVRDSGFGNTLRLNRFERIGYNGIDVFGPSNTIERNFIRESCFSKADCGAIRVFGSTSLAATMVFDVHLLDNVIVDIPGNVDGCHPSRAAFGMGIYVDNYSRDVEVRGNTVANTTITGILFQRSTGTAMGNTVFNASSGTEYAGHVSLGGDESRVTMTGNVLYALNQKAWTLYSRALANFVAADGNAFFHPFVTNQIAHGPSWTRYTFAGWKTYSGLEAHSTTNWFTQAPGETSRGRIFYNATKDPLTFDLSGRSYVDLAQAPQSGNLTLQPFTSKVLVDAASTLHTLSVSLTGDGRVTSSPAGIDCGSDCSDPFPHAAIVTLTPTPSYGSMFTGWGGACGGFGACVVNVLSEVAVSASFAPGAGTLRVKNAQVLEGDSGTRTIEVVVELTATAAAPKE